MKRPFIAGLDQFDIVLGDTTAHEMRQAIDDWMLLHPHRMDVHVKRGKCSDCEKANPYFKNTEKKSVGIFL